MPHRWRRLVRELSDRGFESVYLERLRNRLDVEKAQADLEREIVYETACALGRAEEKVIVALLQLEIAGHDLERATSPSKRALLARRFNELRQLALRARFDLLVHREAVGMRRNDALDALYPIPGPAAES